jgi:hypothetical protein
MPRKDSMRGRTPGFPLTGDVSNMQRVLNFGMLCGQLNLRFEEQPQRRGRILVARPLCSASPRIFLAPQPNSEQVMAKSGYAQGKITPTVPMKSARAQLGSADARSRNEPEPRDREGSSS